MSIATVVWNPALHSSVRSCVRLLWRTSLLAPPGLGAGFALPFNSPGTYVLDLPSSAIRRPRWALAGDALFAAVKWPETVVAQARVMMTNQL
jgi:hypothetical protein